jgi:hypothetical protein
MYPYIYSKPSLIRLQLIRIPEKQSVELVQLTWVDCSGVGEWVSEWVRGQLRFSPSDLLLKMIAEARGEFGTRRKGNVRRWSRYQTTTGEDRAGWEHSVHAVVNCRVCVN